MAVEIGEPGIIAAIVSAAVAITLLTVKRSLLLSLTDGVKIFKSAIYKNGCKYTVNSLHFEIL
jgi:hypothetical protein